MKNLEQIRAKHALAFWQARQNDTEVKGEQGGDVVRGLSSLVINNGLLGTIAFAKEKGKGYDTFMKEIGRFLGSTGDDGRKVLPQEATSLEQFVSVLTSNDSELLQQATAEALAYLGYLKRFKDCYANSNGS
ncbi:MAG: type III-B CRISPR module-associated protein Cmr5 [Betaproteobacteria bacterium]|nr:type III-B CRISPR module-associated protein Cmr5 [Betaproteobacteria bacterium]